MIEIVSLFLYIGNEEIVEKIKHFEKMNQEINSYFVKVQNFFNNTDFVIEVKQRKSKEENPHSITAVEDDKKENEDEAVKAEKLIKKQRIEELTKER